MRTTSHQPSVAPHRGRWRPLLCLPPSAPRSGPPSSGVWTDGLALHPTRGVGARLRSRNTLIMPYDTPPWKSRALPCRSVLVFIRGLVVLGDIGAGARTERLALGETPNIAARIQSLAAPDTVMVSAATYRLIEGYFECQSLGAHALKGVATPIAVYRVLQEGQAASPMDVAAARGLTPLIGRASELEVLLAHGASPTGGPGGRHGHHRSALSWRLAPPRVQRLARGQRPRLYAPPARSRRTQRRDCCFHYLNGYGAVGTSKTIPVRLVTAPRARAFQRMPFKAGEA